MMNARWTGRLAAACLALAASAALATDLQILCPEGARVRLDGADAGVCRAVEEGRFLRDLAPGGHEIEIAVPGAAPRQYEIELDETVPGRLDAREANGPESAQGSLYLQCIPRRCTVHLAGSDIEIEQEDLRLKDVPAGRYVLQFRRGRKSLDAVVFVKTGKPTGVRADFLAGRAGLVSAAEIPRLDDTRWNLAQTWEAALREQQMLDELDAELRRMEALRKGQPVPSVPSTPGGPPAPTSDRR